MRLRRRPKPKLEPTHKLILISSELQGRRVNVYHSGGMYSMRATSDGIVINGVDYTEILLRQGWVDLDDEVGRHALRREGADAQRCWVTEEPCGLGCSEDECREHDIAADSRNEMR